jgi:3-oxocholest-4-en-26-oate---CoA ligase
VLDQWNIADVWEAVADRFPEEPALSTPGRSTSWRNFSSRSDGIASALLAAGLGHQAKVAQYLYNCPEYLESVFACFKAGFVPVNTNYRYTGDELAYLWDNADVEAVVFHSDLVDQCDELRRRLAAIRLWLWVDGGDGRVCPDWAVPYEQAADNSIGARDRVVAPWGRSGRDIFLLYTGGTTGHPKGVVWEQDTLFRMLESLAGRTAGDVADPVGRAAVLLRPGPRVLPAPPLMHGTALWYVMPVLSGGGCVLTNPDRTFDAERLLDIVVQEQVKGLCIVGDAFARPLVEAIEAEPRRWNLDALRLVFSSGVMFSAALKARLLAHATHATISDSLGSSESGRVANQLSTADGGYEATAAFKVGPLTRVIDEQGGDVALGSRQRGRVVVTGHIPVGYYNDPLKTAETFVMLDGRRHVVTGDWAEVEADGAIRLLGRGSICINTGGEKVYPEEVEEAIKAFGGILDAVVVGMPDDRFGEVVVAVVEPAPASSLDESALVEELRRRLAGFKVPRFVIQQPIGRAPNGKADYQRLRADVASTLTGGR